MPAPDATAMFEATRRDAPDLASAKPSRTGSRGNTCGLTKRDRRPGRARGPASSAATSPTVGDGSISRANAREVLEHTSPPERRRKDIVERGVFARSATRRARRAVDAALTANPSAVADVAAGKAQAIGFLVGQVMKATRGQANAALVQAAVRARLERQEAERWASSTSCWSPSGSP